MRARTAIIAALPREISPLVNGWRADEVSPARGVFLAWSDVAVVACAGMGQARARLAAAEAMQHGPIDRILSAGWCGALRGGIAAGSVHRPSRVVDAATGRSFITGDSGPVLVTSAVIADAAEKRRLAVTHNAELVDMEAAAVADFAAQQGIPFAAIKAVSDEFDFELPGLDRFVTADGVFREGAFAAHVAVRPALWPPVLRMARSSSLAARNLCHELRNLLEDARSQAGQAAR